MSRSRPIHNADECVKALSGAVDAIDPPIDAIEDILRVIASYVPYGASSLTFVVDRDPTPSLLGPKTGVYTQLRSRRRIVNVVNISKSLTLRADGTFLFREVESFWGTDNERTDTGDWVLVSGNDPSEVAVVLQYASASGDAVVMKYPTAIGLEELEQAWTYSAS